MSDKTNSGFVLPLKGVLSPAEVVDVDKLTVEQVSSVDEQEPTDSTPRDYFTIKRDTNQSVPTTVVQRQRHQSDSLARVTELLHKTVDGYSPPTSPSPSGLNLNTLLESPMSSTDSLASLIERQNTSKINHPSHQYQLFNNTSRSPFQPESKRSNHPIFNIWASPAVATRNKSRSSSSSIPFMKSPLNNEVGDLIPTRRLAPNVSNPHYVHSSPNVKESKKVYLEYDPVSKRKVLNSYEIIKEIGRGEHGKVKLAKELHTNELVAIKIVDRRTRPKLGRSLKPGSSEEEKIRREIAIMKKVNHPNVVQLKEVLDDTNSRKIYLVLEYLEKGEIKWQKSPNLPFYTLPEVMRIFRDVVLGLEYLHYQGIVHRDIKPANLLISSNGSVKISDFGVSFASSLKSGEQDDYDLAKTAGTPAFFAPELCLPLTAFDDETIKHPKVTHKIDIWALGITLYCLLFGCMPFWASNEFELFKVICSKPLEFPEEYPTNYEWTEEDKFGARNLLHKILDKDPSKRISLKEIKTHPFVLRNLSVEQVRSFTENQKFCEHKIEVSNDEVKVAVTGIASKLRKGFAKALKFAGLGAKAGEKDERSLSDSKAALGVSARTSSTNLIDVKRTLSTGSANHRRAKSSDVTETKTTVEGDLFLNAGSAFNTLNHIMNDDKRRSSISSQLNSGTTNSSSLSEYTNSNNSSFSRNGSQLVSLPVNASFASLDSVYLDNFAPAYVNVQDSRRPKNKEVIKKMSNFSLNKTTEKKSEDGIAPHEPAARFDLIGGDDSDENDDADADESESDGSDDDDDDDDGFGFFIKPKASVGSDQLSEFSVPSHLANDLGPSVATDDTDHSSYQLNTPRKAKLQPQSPKHTSSRKPVNGPKYSFFENSDSESEKSVHTTTITDTEPSYSVEAESGMSTQEDSSDNDDLLMLSFGARGRSRHNTISSPPFERPKSEPRVSPSHVDEQPLYKNKQTVERISSPLAKNAPKTPIANSNAHLLSQLNSLKKGDYVNHYKRTIPDVSYHLNGDTSRGRSNSITVGILTHEHSQARTNSQPS